MYQHGKGRHGLFAVVLALVLTAGMPATAVAVPPPPPNPSDEELESSRSKERARAGEVGKLTNRLADAESKLARLRNEVARKLELANKARVDAQTAKSAAEQARTDATDARNASKSAQYEVNKAEKAKDKFLAGSYRQSSTLGGLSAYLGADEPADVLERAQILEAVSERQAGAIEELKRTRVVKANADAAARKALEVAEKRKAEAAAAERAAETAHATAVEARKSQYSRTADLEAEKESVEQALYRAQQEVKGLEGQRQKYREWKAAKEREERLRAQREALRREQKQASSGGGGGQQVSAPSAPAGASVEAAVNRALSQVGVQYAWGGGNANGPTYGIRDGGVADSYGDYKKIGFDCSGLMIYAFAGVKALPHYSGYQYHSGRKVPLSQARRGDMLFWGTSGIHHVAMYLGNGRMVEAPQSGMRVRVTSVRYGDILPYATRLIG